MSYSIINNLNTLKNAGAEVLVKREMFPPSLDVPCYTIEMWACPAGEELMPKLLHVETPFSPLVFHLTAWLCDSLRAEDVDFKFVNETELEL